MFTNKQRHPTRSLACTLELTQACRHMFTRMHACLQIHVMCVCVCVCYMFFRCLYLYFITRMVQWYHNIHSMTSTRWNSAAEADGSKRSRSVIWGVGYRRIAGGYMNATVKMITRGASCPASAISV